MPAEVAIAPLALKQGLERVVDDIYSVGKGRISAALKRWNAKRKIETLYKKMKAVRYVKTIWQAEKEVDLAAFYYPSRILTSTKERIRVDDISKFPFDGNILIEGTVGQGKSIFFRYLTCREMLRGAALPVFVELRRIPTQETILEYVMRELKAFGFDMDIPTFEFLASEGKVVLFLDAFDEIQETQEVPFITELERLSTQFEKMRILVSSRPESAVAKSPRFRAFQLAPLTNNEYEDVIRRMCQEGSTAEKLIAGVKQSGGQVRSLLSTPLMVALLVVRYRVDQSVPENMVAFFDYLFLLLLQRHDKSKAGYVRKRKSSLGDIALQDVFEAVCFLTRKSGAGAFPIGQLRKITAEALGVSQHKDDAEKVLNDIMKITCLILEEGGDCKFIHKSVQEYYCACFIKSQPDLTAKQFYSALSADKWRNWKIEVAFLRSIDPHRFRKYFVIPNAESFVGLPLSLWPDEVTPELALKCFGDITIYLSAVDHPDSLGLSWGRSSNCWHLDDSSLQSRAHMERHAFFSLGVSQVKDVVESAGLEEVDAEEMSIQLWQIPKNTRLRTKVDLISKKVYSQLLLDIRSIAATVSHAESPGELFSI